MIPIKTVIYVDVLLLVNFLIALFLLLATGLFTGQVGIFWRQAISASVAALSTLVLFAPELPFAVQICYQAIVAVLVIKIAYHTYQTRLFLQLVAWYYLLNLLLAGFTTFICLQSEIAYHGLQTNNLSVYLYLPPRLLIGCVVGVYLALKLFLYCFAAPAKALPNQPFVISLGTEFLHINAFYDTGFSMQDPFGNLPIILLSLPSVRAQLSPSLNDTLSTALQLNTDELTQAMTDSTPKGSTRTFPIRFLPCKTVAGARLLPALRADYMYHKDNPTAKTQAVLIAFCQEENFCQGSQALFGASLAEALLQDENCFTPATVSAASERIANTYYTE